MQGSSISELKQYLDSIGCDYKENEPMSSHTSFRIGGPADIFITPESEDTLASLLQECRHLEIPVTAVGSGTNLLVSDGGIEGAVISTRGLRTLSLKNGDSIVCGAGVKMSRLCKFALGNGLTGLEFAWGLPGSAGGAVFMNAGCYGGEMKDILTCSHHVLMSGERGIFYGNEMQLAYRSSVYSAGEFMITAAEVKLEPGDKELIFAKMDELMQRRLDKQPYYQPSAGSVFKRPVGNFAGTLIEQCGLKGCRVGGAQVSRKHAGFIVNAGGATCNDVLRLISKIQANVKNSTGVELECEIKRVGR